MHIPPFHGTETCRMQFAALACGANPIFHLRRESVDPKARRRRHNCPPPMALAAHLVTSQSQAEVIKPRTHARRFSPIFFSGCCCIVRRAAVLAFFDCKIYQFVVEHELNNGLLFVRFFCGFREGLD